MKKPEQTRQEILAQIERLPLLPSSASHVISIINDPDHNLSDIVKIITYDAVLTGNILRAANSAFYGVPREITSVERAINLMGEEAVVNLTISAATSALMMKTLKGYRAASGELWRHNLFTAIASRKMAALSWQPTNPSLAFTGGLLHDIGKSVVSDFLGETSPNIIAAIDQGKVAEYQEAERRLMGIDHAQAGFEIARHWSLPEPLQQVIRYHHTPTAAPHHMKSLVYCVHLSDIIAMMEGFGTGADTLYYPLDEGYKEYIELSTNNLAVVTMEVQEEYNRVIESLDQP